MNPKPYCVVCTRDPEFRQRLDGLLRFQAELQLTEGVDGALSKIEQHESSILLLDLRVDNSLGLLSELIERKPECATFAFAEPYSVPALEAERLGVYSVESLDPDRRQLQSTIERANEYVMLQLENRSLQSRNGCNGHSAAPTFAERAQQSPVADISMAFRCLDDINSLFEHVIDTIASSLAVSRAGLVTVGANGNDYVFRAGVRCLPGIDGLRYSENDDLPRTLKAKAQVVSRFSAAGRAERQMLFRALDNHGSEALLPIFGKGSLLGWLFVGARSSGVPYNSDDIESLMLVAVKMSQTVEKALLYERAHLQRNLLQSLFTALPTGIVALNQENIILWLNQAAETMLGTSFEGTVNCPVDKLGSQIADFVRAAKTDPSTARSTEILKMPAKMLLELHVQPMSDGRLILIEDTSATHALRLEKDRLHRAEILAEITENMSFDIKAPLTAIKSFAQLLPERFGDRAFCEKFDTIVTREVERLTYLSESICTISRLSKSDRFPTKTSFPIDDCIDMAKCLLDQEWSKVQATIAGKLPKIQGNCERLAECICHLIANARDATIAVDNPKISLSAGLVRASKNVHAIEVAISDNRPVRTIGAFVDNSNLRSSESVRRADLRLSLASQIVCENAGSLEVASSSAGVCVKFLLPVEAEDGR